MIRKDVIFAILTTFCLCALLFSVAPTRSALPYDPWADINEDGKINMVDIANVAAQFGTYGDSTKNVTVANWPTNKLAYSISTTVIAGETFVSSWVSLNGYSKFSICLYSNADNNYYGLQARHIGGASFPMDPQTNFPNFIAKTYDAPNEEIRVVFTNNEAVTRNLQLDIYLIA